jgi:LacI family transcriptional regulator
VTTLTGSNGRPRSVTIDDVARGANVSRQTVSRVLNGKGEISQTTRERVQAVIDELGYRPNLLARSLITRTTHTIGLVVPDISQPFFPEIARGIKDHAHAAGYQMLLAYTAEQPIQEVESLHQMREQRVDGVIVANSRLDPETLAEALDGLGPVVLTNRSLPGPFGSVIWSGYESGGRHLAEHLLERGHTRIGYLDAEPSTTAGAQRFSGYVQALHAADIEFDERLVATAAATPQGGAAATRRLLALDDPPTAIVAYNDIMAVGALHACHAAGRRLPADVAVVGFGDAPLAAWLTPALTTVQVPLHQIGQQAAALLLSLLRGEAPRTVSIDVEPILVVRASSG